MLPTISNSGDNRLLTSTGSSVGVNAENNLTFDGSFLNVVGSGNFDNIFISGIALNEANKEFELKVKRSIKKFYKSMLKDKDVKEMGFEEFEWCCRNGFFGIGWIE